MKFNYADHARGEVVLDAVDEILIASSTFSSNYPTTASSYSQSNFGGYDGGRLGGVVCIVKCEFTECLESNLAPCISLFCLVVI